MLKISNDHQNPGGFPYFLFTCLGYIDIVRSIDISEDFEIIVSFTRQLSDNGRSYAKWDCDSTLSNNGNARGIADTPIQGKLIQIII